jgi:cytosine/adenosine deaminase-related metal-dependent hydrolase
VLVRRCALTASGALPVQLRLGEQSCARCSFQALPGKSFVVDGAAKAMNVADFGLTPGAVANLVVLDVADTVEALRFHPPPAHVISNGRIVDQARMRALASAPQTGI